MRAIIVDQFDARKTTELDYKNGNHDIFIKTNGDELTQRYGCFEEINCSILSGDNQKIGILGTIVRTCRNTGFDNAEEVFFKLPYQIFPLSEMRYCTQVKQDLPGKVFYFNFIKFLIFLLFLSITSELFAQSNVLNITIIHSYEKGTWTNEGTEGVKSALIQSKQSFEINEEIYDYVKLKNNKDKIQRKKEILENLKINKTALVIIFDDEAADDLLISLNETKIPIVLTGINKIQSEIKWFMKEGDPKRFFTGIFERYPFEQSLKMLKTIKPSVNKITILTSENETSRIVTGQIKEKFKHYNGSFSGIRLENTFFTNSWEKWKKVILNNNQHDRSFWILVPWNVNDNTGKEVDLRVMGDFYRDNSKIPEIGIVNINDKLGFIASFSVGAEDLGFQAGHLAIQVLNKKLVPRDTPFVSNNLVRFVINKKRADRLKITIPSAFLDFARIEKKIPMDYFR